MEEEVEITIKDLAQIDLPKQLLKELDIKGIKNYLEDQIEKRANPLKDKLKEYQEKNVIAKLGDRLVGNTTDMIIDFQELILDVSTYQNKLIILNLIFSKLLNEQGDKISNQQVLLEKQNKEIVDQQIKIKEINEKLEKQQETILKLHHLTDEKEERLREIIKDANYMKDFEKKVSIKFDNLESNHTIYLDSFENEKKQTYKNMQVLHDEIDLLSENTLENLNNQKDSTYLEIDSLNKKNDINTQHWSQTKKNQNYVFFSHLVIFFTLMIIIIKLFF